jgi:hypothetical protein
MRSLLISLLLLPVAASAQTIKMLVQSSPLAGFQYHDGATIWSELKVGDPLGLVREAQNPHDGNAVRVEWRGHVLGYLPRAENRSVATEIDHGAWVSGRIGDLRDDSNPWRRLLIDVYVTL